jgi:hypothetical protein
MSEPQLYQQDNNCLSLFKHDMLQKSELTFKILSVLINNVKWQRKCFAYV